MFYEVLNPSLNLSWSVFSSEAVSIKKAVLKNFAIFRGKHLLRSFFLIKLQVWSPVIVLRETPIQVFPCEYCKIFRNTYFEEHLRTTASAFPSKSMIRGFNTKIKHKINKNSAKGNRTWPNPMQTKRSKFHQN